MKACYLTPILIALVGGCSVYETEIPNQLSEGKKSVALEFTAITGEEEDTKTEWQPNGQIWWNPSEDICIFYGNSGKNRFTSTNDEKVKRATFSGTINAFTGETESGDFNYFWAVYPYDAAVSCDGSSVVATLPHNQIAQAGTFSPNTNLTLAKSAGLSLAFYNVCAWFRFSVAHEGVKVVTFRGNNNEDVAGTFCVSVGNDGRPTTPVIQDDLGQKEIRLTLPENASFEVGQNYYFTLLPQVFSSGFTLTFETQYMSGSRSVSTSVAFIRNVYHYGNSFDENIDLVPYVDLGLSVKWAKRNLSQSGFVSSCEGYGDYYAWGEVEPKNSYSWSNYAWGTNYNSLSKYNNNGSYGIVDNKTALDAEDDVAHVLLGDKWRIPTKEEWEELGSYGFTWNWTDNYNGTGVRGINITKDSNSKSIFLPAGGYYNPGLDYLGDEGSYWSSTLDPAEPYKAWYQSFDNDTPYEGYYFRYFGRSVRAVYDDRIHPESITLNKTSLSLSLGNSEQLTATITPSNSTNKNLIWFSSNTSVATVDPEGVVSSVAAGTTTITVETVDGGLTATCSVTVPSIPIPIAVDLELPSGTKWASFNLGASNPEDYGEYYAWGDIELDNKWSYSWDTYKWCNGSRNSLTKYNTSSSLGTVDNKTTLEGVDDVAHIELGGNWRMPTYAEYYELLTQCTWANSTRNGVNGKIVTGNNGNSVFIPKAGWKNSNGPSEVGTNGYYWTSSLYTDDDNHDDYAWCVKILVFDSYDIYDYFTRCSGLTIRPVID